MAILGYDIIGTVGTLTVVTGGILGSVFIPSSDVTSSTLSGYIYSTGTTNFRFGICKDEGGLVGDLIATSSLGTITTTPTWVTVPFVFNFKKGIAYWFTAQAGDNLIFVYDAGNPNQTGYDINVTAGNAVVQWPNFPDNPAGNPTYFNYVTSIYATVTDTLPSSEISGLSSVIGLQSIIF